MTSASLRRTIEKQALDAAADALGRLELLYQSQRTAPP